MKLFWAQELHVRYFQAYFVVYVDALRDVLREMKTPKPLQSIMETIESKISSDNVESLKQLYSN